MNLQDLKNWEDGIGKVICADCLDLMKMMPDNCVDTIITSPPYNKTGFRGYRDNSKGKGRWSGSDIKYGNYLDDKKEEDYKKWQIKILNECYRIIKKTGSIFYNHKIRRANNKASHPFEWINKTKSIFYQQIIWDRKGSPDHNINYLTPTTELFFWLTKEKPKVFKKQNENEIWRLPAKQNNLHPAPFPIALCEKSIKLTTNKNDLIFDPFMGSWTTAVACTQLNRRFIGCEISEEYCKIGEKRLKNVQMPLI